jgi:hypothetical protein
MPTIEPSQAIVAQVVSYKTVIGWSWLEVSVRLSWGPRDLASFKGLKKPIQAEQLEYLEKVADAVAGIEMRQPEAPVPPAMNPQPEAIPGGARAMTAAEMGQDRVTRIAVMTLDDIAAKLTQEYFDVASEAGISTEELAGARFAVARIADRCGVAEQVKALIAGRRPTAGPAGLDVRRGGGQLTRAPGLTNQINPAPPPHREPFPLEAGF